MAILSKLISGLDAKAIAAMVGGTRKTMCRLYDYYLKENMDQGEYAHAAALVGALLNRYGARKGWLREKTPPNWELYITSDIAPFIGMTPSDAKVARLPLQNTLYTKKLRNTPIFLF